MKQYVPALGISLECGTDAVPKDGRYHVMMNGEVVASFRSQNAALRRYKGLIAEAGGYPKPEKPSMTAEDRRLLLIRESVHKRLDLAEDYWGAAATKHKGKKYTW